MVEKKSEGFVNPKIEWNKYTDKPRIASTIKVEQPTNKIINESFEMNLQ